MSQTDQQTRGVTVPGTNTGSYAPDVHPPAPEAPVTVMPVEGTWRFPPRFHTAQETIDFWMKVEIPEDAVASAMTRRDLLIDEEAWNYMHYVLGITFTDKDAAGYPPMLQWEQERRAAGAAPITPGGLSVGQYWEAWEARKRAIQWEWRQQQIDKGRAFIRDVSQGAERADDPRWYHLKEPHPSDDYAVVRCINMLKWEPLEADEAEKVRSHRVQLPSGEIIQVRDAWNRYGGNAVAHPNWTPVGAQQPYREQWLAQGRADLAAVQAAGAMLQDRDGNWRRASDVIWDEDHGLG